MSRLLVAPIVEGHGDEASVRILLQRVWSEIVAAEFIDVLRPIRRPRSKLVQQDELVRAVNLAALKINASGSSDPAVVLILVDANGDPPCILGPALLRIAQRADVDVCCVIANLEFETWFVAAAESLRDFLDVEEREVPNSPEQQGVGKLWIQRRFRGPKYSETLDQPAMTARMDLAICRTRSPSFDKLCREFERRAGPNT